MNLHLTRPHLPAHPRGRLDTEASGNCRWLQRANGGEVAQRLPRRRHRATRRFSRTSTPRTVGEPVNTERFPPFSRTVERRPEPFNIERFARGACAGCAAELRAKRPGRRLCGTGSSTRLGPGFSRPAGLCVACCLACGFPRRAATMAIWHR